VKCINSTWVFLSSRCVSPKERLNISFAYLQEGSVFLEVLDKPSHVGAWSNFRIITNLPRFAEWVKETRRSPFDFIAVDVSDFGVEAVPVDIVRVKCKSAFRED
jgi:hypothetical protein